MKLNLGCGELIRPGFINVDTRNFKGVDTILDITKKLPWQDGFFEYVLAEDILEHFPLADTGKILIEWLRVLKINGTAEIFVPNVRKHINMFLKNECNLNRLSQLLYGGQDYKGNFHYRCFDLNSLKSIMEKCGLKEIRIEEQGRGLRAYGKKK